MNNPQKSHIPHRLRPFQLITALAMLLLAATACKTVKQTPHHDGQAGIAAIPPQQRFDSLTASYAEWTDVSLPVRLSIQSPKDFSVTAQCSMKRNQCVQFSVRMLGFEVARVWLDNDSIHAVDRYHKRYLSESLRRILGNNDVTIGNLQDLLMGRAFLTGRSGGTLTAASAGAVRLIPSEQGLMILPKKEPDNFNYGFILDTAADNVAAASITVGQNHAVVVNYSTFYLTDAGAVTSVADIETAKGKPLKFSLTWNLQSAKWNRGVERQWEQPSGYTRIATGKILELLSEPF